MPFLGVKITKTRKTYLSYRNDQNDTGAARYTLVLQWADSDPPPPLISGWDLVFLKV